ncbi:hypothetical protein TA3x_001568 [Tundrisphaera sp. TA3]|uniref:hypothetical protein n=1 Tax=Tundrisphaera sp. TA3 TaxID=3435775 RepID=UPI003EC09522
MFMFSVASGRRSATRPVRFALLICAGIAAGPPASSRADDNPSRNEYDRRSGSHARTLRLREPRAHLLTAAAPCPPVSAGQIYRFIDGIDDCLVPMAAGDLAKELNDPWGALVLRKNAGGAGPWPGSVADIVAAMSAVSTTSQFQQFSYLLGEGTQIPTTIAPRTGNRDLRYVVTWGPSIASPGVFLSAAPAGVSPGQPPPFLQVIAFDATKQKYNYYQYVSNSDVSNDPGATRTWSWAGDTSFARDPRTVGRGCFACHLNGGLNMKELTPPWNNWQSPQASVNPAVVPPEVAADPLFLNLSGADKFQQAFQGAQFNLGVRFVRDAIQGNRVNNPPELLRRLIETTTVNFASSQVQGNATSDVNALPNDFFLNDGVLRNVLNLNYSLPTLTLARGPYQQFVAANQFKLVNRAAANGPPDYTQPGPTFFAFFVPVPAYEDAKAIQQLVLQRVISPKFAAAVLMVDFPNPIFSPARSSLGRYAARIGQANLTPDPQDAETQFAALVTQAAAGQPACNPASIASCTPEQQFLFYWNRADWQAACQQQLGAYLAAVGNRIATPEGVNDYMTLSVARANQFSTAPLVSNLHEFDLLLPCTGLGSGSARMNADGTITTEPAIPGGFSPCAATPPSR